MKALLIFVLATWASFSAVFGAVEKAQIRFLAEALHDGIDRIVWVAGGNQGEPFTLPVNQLSEPFTVLQREIKLQNETDKRLLTIINLPEAGDSFIVLLLPGTGGMLKSAVIPSVDPSFRAGDVFLYNDTELPIVGRAGLTEIELAPGQGKPVRPSGGASAESHEVTFSVREAGGLRLLRTMRWPVQTRFRSYGFFFRNPGKNRIEFRAVDEFVASPKKPARK